MALLLLASCGGDGGGDDGAEGASQEQDTPATGAPLEPPPGAQAGDQVELELVAEDLQFDRANLTVPPNTQVVLTLRNGDSVPHNFSLYETQAAEIPIFTGETFTGPDSSMTYEFEGPAEPGAYFFRCDTHPTTMTGDFVVESVDV